MDERKILFVGLNTIDLQFLVDRFPESNTKTKALQNEICLGGPATNAAIACAFLHSKVDLLSPVGKSAFSEFIQEEINNFQIRLLDPIKEQAAKPTFASIITSQSNGDRTIFSYHPEKQNINNYQLEFNSKDYRLVLFDGFYSDIAISLAEKFKKEGILTVFDGGSWKKDSESLLKNIDIAICSNDFRVPTGSNPQDIFEYLHKLGVKDIAITRGNDSILCSHKDGREEIQIESIEAIDTLGAGDIFHGAFCHFYANGHNFINSLQRASIVAGDSCKWFGTREWMDKYIKN